MPRSLFWRSYWAKEALSNRNRDEVRLRNGSVAERTGALKDSNARESSRSRSGVAALMRKETRTHAEGRFANRRSESTVNSRLRAFVLASVFLIGAGGMRR